MSFKYPDLQERQTAAAAAKKAMLEKFRAAATDPRLAEKAAERIAIDEARKNRMAERAAAKQNEKPSSPERPPGRPNS